MAFDVADESGAKDRLTHANQQQIDDVAMDDRHRWCGLQGTSAAVDVESVYLGVHRPIVQQQQILIDGSQVSQSHDIFDAPQLRKLALGNDGAAIRRCNDRGVNPRQDTVSFEALEQVGD